MKEIKKTIKILNTVKFLGLLLGAIMYMVVAAAFGETIGVVLGVIAGGGFFFLCEHTRNSIVCDYIVDDLRKAMENMGQEECIFEIKMAKPGMIIRVFFIRAGEMAPRYSKAIIDAIAKSQYRNQVWITQIVDIDSEEELKEAELALNEELLADLKKNRKKDKE